MIQLLVILIINTLVLIAWGKLVHHLDAFNIDKKNEYKLFWFIITGSILNTILVSMMYPFWENVLFSLTGLGYGINPFVTHFLIVGPVEEFTKFLIFIFLTGMFKSIKEPRDGVLQAVSVALGFALMENFLYALNYGIEVLLIRSILGVIGHTTYAAIWGFAWSASVYTTDKNSKSPDRFYIIPFILFASMFHGVYNTLLDYNYVLFALLIKVITLVLFILIYRYVRDNSPYRKYSLKEYKRAIPALKMGLNKFPKSYELNKRMGVFNIYTRKYQTAEKYLRTATRISPCKVGGRFYLGVAKYLISIKSERKDLMRDFDNYSLEPDTEKPVIKKIKNYTQKCYPPRQQKQPVLSNIPSPITASNSESAACHGTWERLVRLRPGHVLLEPHKIGGRSPVVNRAGKPYRKVLDEQVEEWKRIRG